MYQDMRIVMMLLTRSNEEKISSYFVCPIDINSAQNKLITFVTKKFEHN